MLMIAVVSLVGMFVLTRLLRGRRERAAIRREVRREFKAHKKREAYREQEYSRTFERDFDEGFLAEVGIHPHSWHGKSAKRPTR